MSTAPQLPPDLQQFVDQQLAEGKYGSAEELLQQAVRVLQEAEHRRDALREHVQLGIDQLDRGEGIQLADENALREFFDDVQSRGRKRYEASKNAR